MNGGVYLNVIENVIILFIIIIIILFFSKLNKCFIAIFCHALCVMLCVHPVMCWSTLSS